MAFYTAVWEIKLTNVNGKEKYSFIHATNMYWVTDSGRWGTQGANLKKFTIKKGRQTTEQHIVCGNWTRREATHEGHPPQMWEGRGCQSVFPHRNTQTVLKDKQGLNQVRAGGKGGRNIPCRGCCMYEINPCKWRSQGAARITAEPCLTFWEIQTLIFRC